MFIIQTVLRRPEERPVGTYTPQSLSFHVIRRICCTQKDPEI